MQVVSKIELPSSPSSTLSSPPITPKSTKDLLQNMIKVLQQGQESAQHIGSFLNGLVLESEDHQANNIDRHFSVVLNSFKEALCIANSFDSEQEDVIRKRKLDRTNNMFESVDHCKSEDTARRAVSKEKRGCYKRRTGQTRTLEATDLVDDGHAWRKYGQKEILNTNYPRNYYRCTHKHDQKCEATKQVQQISENPTKYNIIYNGNHTCISNLNKTSPVIIDPEENSSIISFETHNYPTVKRGLNSCSFFPLSAFQNNQAMVRQEITSIIKEELPISPSGASRTHSTLNYSSSSENLPSSSDITTSTPVSHQGDSYDYGFDEDVLTNLYMDDHTLWHLDDILEY